MALKVGAMTIESATAADTQSIVSIFIANKGDPGLFQESKAEVRRNLRDFLVARGANGRVVACLGLHRDSAELAEVYGVAVLPELQGQGIGTVLMQKCKERALASQLTCLWLQPLSLSIFNAIRSIRYLAGACQRQFSCASFLNSFSNRFNIGFLFSSVGTLSWSAICGGRKAPDGENKSLVSRVVGHPKTDQKRASGK